MLYRKILIDCLIFFITTLVSLSVIIWVFQAVNYLDVIIEDGRDFKTYIYFSLLNLPKIISKIFPFAIFFSFTYVISRYELKNELVIFWNIGINKIKLYNFLFTCSIVITIFQITLSSLIVPKSQSYARELLRNSDVNFIGSFLKTKNFNDTIKGLTIYIENKDEKNNLKNIFLKKQNLNNDFQITYAKEGYFQKGLNSNDLILIDGETISYLNNKITKFNFSQTNYSLSNLQSNATLATKTQENSTQDLIECILYLNFNNKELTSANNLKLANCSELNLDNIFSEIYKRLIIPFYIPILIIVSLCLIFKSKEKVNYLKFRAILFLIGLGIIIFSESTLRFINEFFIHNLTISSIPFFFIISNYVYIFYQLKNNRIKI